MRSKVILAVSLLSAAFCFAQEKSPVFTAEDVSLMAAYFQKSTIPATVDSTTLAAVQSLRGKLNMALKAKSGKGLQLTDNEKKLVNYMISNDTEAARRILALSQKVFVAPAVAGKDTSKVLAKK